MVISCALFFAYFTISALKIAISENRPIYFLKKNNFYYEEYITSSDFNKKLIYGDVKDSNNETNKIELPYKIYLPDKEKKYNLKVNLSFDTFGCKVLEDLLLISYEDNDAKWVYNNKNGIIEVSNFTGEYYNLKYIIKLAKPTVSQVKEIENKKFNIKVVFQAFEIQE